MAGDTIKVGDKTLGLRLTVGALRRFEARTGVRILEHLTRVWRAMAAESKGELDGARLLELVASVLPGAEQVAAFLYACVPPDGAPTFDEFCDELPLDAAARAALVVCAQLGSFMPQADAYLKKGGPGSAGPLGR